MRKWFIILLAVLIMAPFAMIGTLLYTPLGLSLVAAQLHRLEPMGVRIEGVSGRLTGPLYISRFELDQRSVHIVSHDIVAELRIRELILQTVSIRSLTARDTLVEVRNPGPTPPSTKPLRFLPSFMRLDVDAIEIAGLRYVNIDGTTIDATRLHGRARISPQKLRINAFQIEAPQFNVTGEGRLLAQRPLGLDLRVSGDLRLDRGTELVASAQASGTLEQLTIQATLLRPDVVNVNGLLTRPDNQWRIQASVAAPAISLAPWMEKPPFSLRNIALDVDARPSGIHATGNIGIPEYIDRDLTLDVEGRYGKRVLTIAAAEITVNQSPAQLRASGTVRFEGDTPALDVLARWTDLQWPLTGKALVSSTDGELSLRGPLPYDYSIRSHLAVPLTADTEQRIVEGAVRASGMLAKERITLNDYVIEALDGSVTGTGSLNLTQPGAWEITARATGINPAYVNSNFPGSVDAVIDAHGQGLNRSALFTATVANLAGTLRSERLRASGLVERNSKGWRVERATASLGEVRLALNGTLYETVDASWSLQAHSLQMLLPQARGTVDLTGTARGPATTPHIVADLAAQDLGYEQWRVGDLSVKADIDLASRSASSLTLNAQRIGLSEPLIESLLITGNGVAQEHLIEVAIAGIGDAKGNATHAKLRINGKLADQAWSGTVLATDISDGRKTGEALVMAEPATFLMSRDRAFLEKLCVAPGRGQICADGQWRRDGPWQGTLSGYEIPLAIVLPPSGPEAEYSGRIEGRVRVSGAPGQAWVADAGARIIDAAVIYKPPGADPQTLNLGNGGLSATATAARLDFSLGLQAFEDTFLYANARIERNGSNDLLHLPLTGDVRARAADANILPIVFTEVDKAAGLLTANIDVHGTLAAPQIGGRIQVANGEFESYRVNLALRDLNLLAELADNSISFSGNGRAGDGRLDVGGRLRWTEGNLNGNLQLKGDNLLVSDLPEYRVVASPDLTFDIDGQRIGVTGNVVIPSARIQPVNLSGAVQSSQDAHYVGETSPEQQGRMEVRSEVRIQMGDDVRVEAFGLQGKILGGVSTIVQTGETAIGRGELSVDIGRYEAYGQKLDITRGRLLFDASPLNDPGLDIEARRKIETITVGMNVRGTLRAPRLTFFSDPSMPQSSIVSYLLTGKGMDNMQSGDAATMSSASDELAVQGGGLLASQIGRRLGLEEVGVESSTGSSGETNTALVLGKFLSPRLYISYGISLTESINTFKLRYTISDKWLLKMEAGEVQSADAEYTIER